MVFLVFYGKCLNVKMEKKLKIGVINGEEQVFFYVGEAKHFQNLYIPKKREISAQEIVNNVDGWGKVPINNTIEKGGKLTWKKKKVMKMGKKPI